MEPDRLSSSLGFATVAMRISSWTTKGLLTVIVLLAGLGFGRQILKWWANNASAAGSSAIALATDGLGDAGKFSTIQFGDDRWSLRRRAITGDRNRAVAQLRAACREVLRAGPSAARPPQVEEQKFLACLTEAVPVERKAEEWRVYEFPATFPMAVGLARPVRTVEQTFLPAQETLAQAGYRVVVWGIAAPMGKAEWTLCTFQLATGSAEVGRGPVEVPLPPGGHRTLSMQAEGTRTVALSGPDRPGQWKRFYDEWFMRQGWRSAASWRPFGAAWRARFAAPDRGGLVDIHFGPDGRGGLSGLLLITACESR